MTIPTKAAAWNTLKNLARSDFSVADEFVKDTRRFEHYSIEAAGLLLDYSKQKINKDILASLLDLAAQQSVASSIEALFSGENVNTSEALPALHTALRNSSHDSISVHSQNIMPEINACLEKMQHFSEDIRAGRYTGFSGKPIRDVVNIGVGGSDLGPAMAYRALETYNKSGINAHFISNLDSYHLNLVLRDLNPETTLFVVASKSFSTQETRLNAKLAWDWLKKTVHDDQKCAQHFFAVTAKRSAAIEFGILPENILPLWDWVGGRFSLWSAVGFVLVITLGMQNFKELLAGAEAMDMHFRHTELSKNMPVILALVGVWNQNFLGAHSQAIIPYDQRLNLFPSYLQQLLMESLGKRISVENEAVDYTTGVVIWGGVGTNSQHAFHQLFMQGTQWVPIDFILSLNSTHAANEYHSHLIANCLSQARTLMQGKTQQECVTELLSKNYSEAQAENLAPHLMISGGCPSSIIMMEALTPYNLASLIALYEHMAYVQSVIWRIDAFDQWGVEWGKKLAKEILMDLENPSQMADYDASTRALMNRFLNRKMLESSD